MQGITEPAIRRLVDAFYAKIRTDPQLGPIFEQAIGDGWDAHLVTMVDFWSSVMLTSGRYKGSPVEAHRRVDRINSELFPRWLELFDATCREELRPDVAAMFAAKAARIADNLQRALYYRPELQSQEAAS